ncbi:hypothetical protein GVI04_15220 [Escherichia coli]|nr:hypothetical protein [Escherichia coli]MBE9760131.1 hypothetical protein [Escherichia coli]MBE9874209.1 hypothetical protein [Escherichia coli]
MNDKISQDTINKALWAACDTFRGTISADTYKDFILTMLFRSSMAALLLLVLHQNLILMKIRSR